MSILSVHRMYSLSGISSFSEIVTANRNLSTAAINSRRRMSTDLIGDTLPLAVTRATEICPLTYPYLAQLTEG